MATYTFYLTANSGGTTSYDINSSYTRAREGTSTVGGAASNGTRNSSAGQLRANSYLYQCNQTLFEFDTASLAGKSITSATLYVWPHTLYNAGTFTIEARLADYGTSITAADFLKGSLLSGYTSLATIAHTALTVGAYRAFTSVALAANINKTGKTRMLLASDQQRLNSAPANNAYEYVMLDNYGDPNPAYLVVETNETTGSLTKTLASATVSSAAVLSISGNVTASLANATLTTAATLSSVAAGNVVAFLANATASIIVATETHGYLEATLANATLNTVALVDLNGSVTATLANATLNAFGGKPIAGNLTVTLGNATLQTSTLAGISGAVTATLANAVLSAAQTTPMWPTVYGFPQSPLEGTWRPTLGDDTLRSEREIGARQVRSRNGGNYSEVAFAIAIVNRGQKVELDRFFEQDCQAGTRPFLWEDPETGVLSRFTWMAPPLLRDWDGLHFVAECDLRKENA